VSFYQGVVALISGGLVWVSSYGGGYLGQEGILRRIMEMIAARSYSLYLVHIPVYFAARELWYRMYDLVNPNRHQALVIVGLAVLATFGIAELNHRILEKPLRAHGKFLAAQYRARTMLETV
jgi:peptidoglycan/LPS O-acetylase OafA/YrhL